MNRRSLVFGAAALAGCAHTAPEDSSAFLHRAINAAGGERALRAARVLTWTGSAVIHAGGRDIEIGVNTIVEPFIYARSETWRLSQGRASTRVLEIDPTGGWATINGARTPLPAAQLAHERQQFALYGLMRLVPLLDPGVSLGFVQRTENAGASAVLMVQHPQAPPTNLLFDTEARLVGAQNTVLNPEAGGAPIAQVFSFEGVIESGGVRWPRVLRIQQNGQPFFDLTLETFTPRERLN